MATLYGKLDAPAISVFLDKHGNKLTNDQLAELAKPTVNLEGFSAEQIADYTMALTLQGAAKPIAPAPVLKPRGPNLPPHRAPNAPTGNARA